MIYRNGQQEMMLQHVGGEGGQRGDLTFGSRELSIFPIWRAINVLPVPGGP